MKLNEKNLTRLLHWTGIIHPASDQQRYVERRKTMFSGLQKVLRGLIIISKYDADSDFAAEHDQIYCGSEELEINEEHKKELDELGWFTDEDSWSCFV